MRLCNTWRRFPESSAATIDRMKKIIGMRRPLNTRSKRRLVMKNRYVQTSAKERDCTGLRVACKPTVAGIADGVINRRRLNRNAIVLCGA